MAPGYDATEYKEAGVVTYSTKKSLLFGTMLRRSIELIHTPNSGNSIRLWLVEKSVFDRHTLSCIEKQIFLSLFIYLIVSGYIGATAGWAWLQIGQRS